MGTLQEMTVTSIPPFVPFGKRGCKGELACRPGIGGAVTSGQAGLWFDGGASLVPGP